jgi:hypothetical protein
MQTQTITSVITALIFNVASLAAGYFLPMPAAVYSIIMFFTVAAFGWWVSGGASEA